MEIEIQDIIRHLRPNVEWVLRQAHQTEMLEKAKDGIMHEGLEFVTSNVQPLSIEEILDAESELLAIKQTQLNAAQAQKQAILDRLGLTEDDLKALGL